MRISEAFETYRLEHIVFRNQSSRTEEMSRLACQSLVSYAGDVDITDLTFDTVRRWRDQMAKSKGQNTVRGYIIKLRVVLNHLSLKGIPVLNPDLVGVPKRKTTVVHFITPAEIARLIECVFEPQAGYSTHNRYRNRAMVSVLAASGVRVSELISLDRLSIQEDGTFTVIGKGDKARLCFLDSRAIQHLNEYLAIRRDTDKALFVSEQTGKRISKSTVEEALRTGTRRGGFEKPVTPHTIRHSFATDMLRNNANLVYVRDFLGHTSVQTTEMYTHVVNNDLKEIYRKAHTY